MGFCVQGTYTDTIVRAIFQDLSKGCKNLLEKALRKLDDAKISSKEKNPDFWTTLSCFHRTVGCKVQNIKKVYISSLLMLLMLYQN